MIRNRPLFMLLSVMLGLGFALHISGSAPASALGFAADRVLVNGRILTVDARDSVAEAVAIKSGRILAVGSNREIEALVGPETERIDLHGLTATPGLLDAHCHFAGGAFDRLYVLDLSYPTVENIGEAVAKVKDLTAATKPGDWVRGRGWDEGKLAEGRYIYASDLDSVSSDHPVWLTHTMGHYGVANSVALELAGITRETPDPPGGTIDRYPDGTPTGVLKETAQSLVGRLVPGPTAEQRREAIRTLAREFNKEGMSGLKEPGIGVAVSYDGSAALETWEAYQDVLAEGALTVRVFALWRSPDSLEGARELADRIAPFSRPYVSTGDDHLISGGVKLFADGSGGARTAWLYEDWNKNHRELDAGNRGYPAIDPQLLRDQIQLYHDTGLHVSVHAIGDRAIDWVVDSYALALRENPMHGRRHGIIHANIPSDRAIETIAELQRTYDAGFPEPSATFTWWIGDTYAGNFGPERCLRLNPFKTYLENGIRWAGGSDYDVTPFPARYGIWAAMTRRPLLGVHGSDPFGRKEAIDVRSALRSHTLWAAHQMFLEDKIGSIEVGKYADIAVWDNDPYSAPVDAIKELACQLTLFQGEVVYRAEGARLSVSRGSQGSP
jgi:predicted amidohydrolase YtcJ